MFKNISLVFTFVLVCFAISSLQAQNYGKLYFVFLNSNPDKPQIAEEEKERLQAEHLANLDELARQGKLHAAGPFEGGGGILVLESESMEDAKAMVQSDPAVQAHRFKTEIYPFKIGANDICGAEEPYEMVTYQLIRYTSNPDYFESFDEMHYANRKYLSKLNNENDFVLIYGSFSDYNDGIVILDVATAEEAEKIAKAHPSVAADQLTYEVKTLWIAKGTFCKK